MIRVPGTDRWIVVQMNGQVVSFRDQMPRDVKTAIKLSPCWRAYAIVFHPKFPGSARVFHPIFESAKRCEGNTALEIQGDQ